MSALDKVLLAAGVKPAEPPVDPAANATETEGLVGLALSVGARTGLTAEDIAYLVLAADDDGGQSKSDDNADYDPKQDPYYKKLIAKGVNPKMAAAICQKKHDAAGKDGDGGKKPNPFAKKDAK